MKTSEEIVRFLASKPDVWRLGSCETDDIVEYADCGDRDWQDMTDEEKHKASLAGDYFDFHSVGRKNAVAWYLEENDGGVWRVVGFGTAGRSFERQCSEIVDSILRKTYIYSCSNGFRDWSRIPPARSRQELELKLAALGM